MEERRKREARRKGERRRNIGIRGLKEVEDVLSVGGCTFNVRTGENYRGGKAGK